MGTWKFYSKQDFNNKRYPTETMGKSMTNEKLKDHEVIHVHKFNVVLFASLLTNIVVLITCKYSLLRANRDFLLRKMFRCSRFGASLDLHLHHVIISFLLMSKLCAVGSLHARMCASKYFHGAGRRGDTDKVFKKMRAS